MSLIFTTFSLLLSTFVLLFDHKSIPVVISRDHPVSGKSMLCCNSVARFGSFGLIFSKYWHFHVIFGGFWQILNWPKLPDFKASPDLDSNFHQKLPILAFLTDFWQKMHLNYLVMLFQQSIKYTEKELSLVWCKRKETKFW